MGFRTSNLADVVKGNVSDKLLDNYSNHIFFIPVGDI